MPKELDELTVNELNKAFNEKNALQDQVQLQYRKGVITNYERLMKQADLEQSFNNIAGQLMTSWLLNNQ